MLCKCTHYAGNETAVKPNAHQAFLSPRAIFFWLHFYVDDTNGPVAVWIHPKISIPDVPWLPPQKEHGQTQFKTRKGKTRMERKIDLDAFQFTPEETRGGNIFFFESRERIPGNGLMWYHLLLFFLLRHRRLGAIGRDSTKVLKWNLTSQMTHHVHSPAKKNFILIFLWEFMESPTSEHFQKDKCAALTEGKESRCPATKKNRKGYLKWGVAG